MTERSDTLSNIFTVVTDPQSYVNILYLLLSFPLGLFYFIFLVVGISLGVGLAVIFVGILLLVGVLVVSYGLTAFERTLTRSLLKVDIPPMTTEPTPHPLGDRFRAMLVNPVTWKGIVYLLAKFAMGVFSFSVVVALVSLSLGLIAAPFFYNQPWAQYDIGLWEIDTMSGAVAAAVIGAMIGVGSLYLFNLMARVWGEFARIMLGQAKVSAPAPEASGEEWA